MKTHFVPREKKAKGVIMAKLNRREVGSFYEQKVKLALEKKQVEILEMNYRCKMGEIDLIGKDGPYLVFFEVKYRVDEKKGYAAEAIDRKKQYRICRVADYYRISHHVKANQGIRFDAIVIDNNKARWIKNAYEYQEKR